MTREENLSPAFAARSPGTGTRILLFLALVAGGTFLLLLGFPPGAPDRLPVLVIALALALYAARSPERGILVFSLLFPCSGLLVRIFGGTDPTPWPALLLAGLAAGWSFRFIYDFETVARPTRLDAPLRALLIIWICATLLAVARAHTVWAASKGLTGRTVNGDGLLETAAIRDSFLSFSSLAAGAAFFFLLRRSDGSVRRKALSWALAGVSTAAAAAGLQRLGVFSGELRGFWKVTGRLSGGAVDPNSLGLTCALLLPMALLGATAGGGRRRVWSLVAILFLVPGLLLSGSRSAFGVVGGALTLLLFARGVSRGVRVAGLALLAFLIVLLAAPIVRSSPGSLGDRIAQTFNPALPIEYRTSARPQLWRAAWELFRNHPVEGGGMGVFSWRLPDLLRERNRALPMRDNPGSAYLQALAETGSVGFLLTAVFAVSLAAQAVARIRRPSSDDPLPTGAAVSVLAFLLALLLGSHWFAPDVSLLLFLLAGVASWPSPNRGGARAVREGTMIVYAAAAFVAILTTASAQETFRFAPTIGFYAPETGGDETYRWTRRNFAIWVGPGEKRRLVLRHATPFSRPIGLEVSANGRTVFRSSLAPQQEIALRLRAPARPVAFVFRLSDTFIPRRYGPSNDRRELGLRAAFPSPIGP